MDRFLSAQRLSGTWWLLCLVFLMVFPTGTGSFLQIKSSTVKAEILEENKSVNSFNKKALKEILKTGFQKESLKKANSLLIVKDYNLNKSLHCKEDRCIFSGYIPDSKVILPDYPNCSEDRSLLIETAFKRIQWRYHLRL